MNARAAEPPAPAAGLPGRDPPGMESAMFEVPLLIAGRDVPASQGATFERRNPVTGEVASRAAAATPADAVPRPRPRRRRSRPGRRWGPGRAAPRCLKAADLLEARTGEVVERMMAEIGATAPWAGFNAYLAADMLRDAAALTTQVDGEVIPSDRPNTLPLHRPPAGRGGAGHRPLERAHHPGGAGRGLAARLRQHGGAQVLGDLPGHPPPHRRGAARRRPSARDRSTWSPARRPTPRRWCRRSSPTRPCGG